MSKFRNRNLIFTEGVFRKTHAPFRQIRERTDSSDFLEIHCKRDPGHRRGFGKIFQMP